MNVPRRITLVLDDLLGGGAARVAVQLSRAWTARGYHVTIMTNDDGSQPPHFPPSPGVVHKPLGLRVASHNLLAAVRHNLWRLFRLRRAIKASKPDVLLSFLDGNNVLCLLATRRLGLGRVVISERTDPHGRDIGFFWENLRRITYPWADCLVTQSAHALAYFPTRIRAKGMIIPNPVEAPEPGTGSFREQEGSPRHQLVTLGSLRKIKGHDLLIEAFALIAKDFPDWELVIYGEGPERPKLARQSAEHGLGTRVHMPGHTADVSGALSAGDLFVLPSRAEGFPNALAEAMALGLAAVSFDCPSGPGNLIRDGVDGVLVPPQDIAALASALASLMSAPRQRSRLGNRAREVVARFSPNQIINLWEQALTGTAPITKQSKTENGAIAGRNAG